MVRKLNKPQLTKIKQQQFYRHSCFRFSFIFFGSRYIGDDLLLGPNLVSFNRTVFPYEISKVETKILVSMSEEI